MLERFAAAQLFIVDDNESNVALLRAVLTRAGISKIFTETDSRQVLRRLPQIRPDLLILDLHMPGLDGFAVLEQVNQFAVSDYLPVLVLTADITAAASDRALSAGAQDFVTKPFINNEVVLRVRNLLETRFLFTALRGAGNLGDNSELVLEMIARRAVELTAADHALIAVPADQDATRITALAIATHVGSDTDTLNRRIIPLPAGVTGMVFVDHVPRKVTELDLRLADGSQFESGPALVCPLGGDPATRGVLLTGRMPGSATFDDHDLRLLSTFADQAGLAWQRAEYHSAQHELAVLADRDRIARDLHDHVIQRLFAVGMAMQSTHRREKDKELAGRITDHISQLSAVVKEIRTAIFELEDDPTKMPSVRTMLTATVNDLTADAAFRTTVHMSGPLDALPAGLAGHADAVVREATANAVRHSHASQLTIAITSGDALVIAVTDDGIGIPVDPARRSGTRNLDDRAATVGGTFTLNRVASGGTRLVWTAPLDRIR